MSAHAVVFILSLTTATALTPLVRRAASGLGVVDAPDGFRKTQKRPVPRMGGVAIFVAFFSSLLLGSCLSSAEQVASYPTSTDFLLLLFGAAAVLLVGLLDDVHGLSARGKFIALALVAVGMHAGGYQIRVTSNPFGSPISLGYLAFPVTFFWFVGCMHAMNLIDGLDGLAGGVTLFAAATVFVTSVLFGNAATASVCIALAGAVLGFLLFNFHPASIYLGDSGSYLLGFLIACAGLRGAQKSNMVVGLLVPLIALGVPVMDTTLSVIRRWSRALPLSASDRQHIHHKLLNLGFSHRQAVLIMYAGCVVLAGFAVLLAAATNVWAAALLLLLGLAASVVVHVVGSMEIELANKRLSGFFRLRRRSKERRTAGYMALERMQQAETVDSVWNVFSVAAERMELDYADLGLSPAMGPKGNVFRAFRRERAASGPNGGADVLWRVMLPLIDDGERFGELEVHKTTNGDPLGPEVPEMLDLLSAGLAANIKRVQPTAQESLR